MKDSISNIIDKIINESASPNSKVKNSLIMMVKNLEYNKEFRDYIRETLKDKKFHENCPHSYRKFPFEIVTLLYNAGVPPEENFLIQDIDDTFDIKNKIFIEFLITELFIYFFPTKFIEEKIFSKKEYYKLYRLYNGY